MNKEGCATRAGKHRKPNNRIKRPPNQKGNKSQITPPHNTKRRHLQQENKEPKLHHKHDTLRQEIQTPELPGTPERFPPT